MGRSPAVQQSLVLREIHALIAMPRGEIQETLIAFQNSGPGTWGQLLGSAPLTWAWRAGQRVFRTHWSAFRANATKCDSVEVGNEHDVLGIHTVTYRWQVGHLWGENGNQEGDG